MIKVLFQLVILNLFVYLPKKLNKIIQKYKINRKNKLRMQVNLKKSSKLDICLKKK